MRKIILNLATSFDEMIEGPKGEIDWITFEKDDGDELTSFLEEIDTVLYGRTSYELWGNYQVTEKSSPFERTFYGALNKMSKYVFSTTRDSFDGDPEVIAAGITDFVEKLKQQPGKHIWLYGGSGLVTTFMNLNLVDEFRIAMMPIILGQGKPLFKDIKDRQKLKLLKTKTSKSGVLQVYYESVK